MKTIRYIRPRVQPSKYIENSMTSGDIEMMKKQRKALICMAREQVERDLAEQRYVHDNVCCGYVLPYNGICDICGKHHKIVR